MKKWAIRSLIDKLNRLTESYDKGHPEVSDEEWDNLYFELKQWEDETGIIYPDSPTQNIHFEKVSELKKVKHNHPMLSLDKTKDLKDIESFLKGHNKWIAMAKMDGLTCSLRYVNRKLVSAETRGNGIEGEDITHNALIIPSIPKEISFNTYDEIIVDGEIICTYKDFELFKNIYKNPRNFASGSIRLLNAKECYNRHLTFVAWDAIIKDSIYNTEYFNVNNFLSSKLYFLQDLGFTIVPFNTRTLGLKDSIEFLKGSANYFSYPIDGVVFKYDNIKEYEAAGRTDHHFKGGLAYKFYDEIYELRLRRIEWAMGRTGVLTPVAVFDPIDIDGSTVERASLHNVSIMREVLGNCAYVGEPLQVYKANKIMRQMAEA